MSNKRRMFAEVIIALAVSMLASTVLVLKVDKAKLINACEAELPRNQQCKLIAVIEGGNE